MPQFILDGKDAPTFAALDPFTQGYIEAMFFTECEPGTTRETWKPETQSSLPGDVGFCDLAPDALARINHDCAEFQRAKAALLSWAYQRNYDATQAGRDFWFTRCGHGVGYWDRKELEAKGLGDALSEAARKCGQRWAYLGDDGRVYLS